MAKKQFIIDELNTGNKQQLNDLLNISKGQGNDFIKKNIIIDPTLKAFIPPLTLEEIIQLESNILAEGIRDELIIWENPQKKGAYVLIDGHNRFSIASKHNLDFKVKVMTFANEEQVQNWMIANQLGKRNLTETQKAYLRGKQYQQEKKNKGTNQYNSGVDKMSTPSESQGVDKMSTPQKTHEKLAEQYKVSSKTIQRDEKYAEQIDMIVGEDSQLKWQILNKEIDLPKNILPTLAQQVSKKITQIREDLKNGKPVRVILQEINPQSIKSPREEELAQIQKETIQQIQTAVKKKDKSLIDTAIQGLKTLKNKF